MKDYIYHHGIKGMKWGVRRFQKKDGSLTPAGKERYNDNSPKQSRYDKLYNKYKKAGYSDEDAVKMAKGRVVTERALTIIGGVAVGAAVAYGAYRYHDINVDRVISPNQVMQTVHQGDISDRISPGNPFFASYTKRDNVIYASKVFSHFGEQSKVTKFYTKDGIKAASEKTGRKIFDELIQTNPEIAAYSQRIGHFKDGRKAYERFNYSLVLRNNSETAKKMGLGDLDHDKIHNIFYNELKKRGYGAVVDVNDSRREGFTYNPVIVFDNQIKHVIGTTKATSDHLSMERAKQGLKYARQRKTLLNPATNPTALLAGYSYLYSVGAISKADKDLDNRIQYIEQYKKEHPNTRLTDSKIAEMYDG